MNKRMYLMIATALITVVSIFGCTSEKQNKTSPQSITGEDVLTNFTKVGDEKSLLDRYVAGRTSRTTLVEIPVDPTHNTQVFRSNDATETAYENAAFIAPKLFAYGTQQGGQVVVKKHANGNVTISFNVAFIDGKSETFMDSKSINKISVPDAYRIQNLSGLETELAKNFHIEKSKISTLAGCPKLIVINYAGKEYNVTPKRFIDGDSCTLDPFAVSLTVTKEDAKDILYNQLPNGTVDVGAVYETKTALAKSKVHTEYNKQSLYNDLLSSLKVNWFVDVEAKNAVTDIVKNKVLKITVQGSIPDEVNDSISKIMNDYFEPMLPNPDNADTLKCEKVACLQFRKVTFNQSDIQTFDYTQISNDLVGYSYVSSTKLKSTSKSAVTLGSDQACKENCGRVVNDRKNNSTFLSLTNATAINIKPELLIYHTRNQHIETTHTDHEACQVSFLQASGMSVNSCNKHFNIPAGSTGKTVCNSCVAGYSNQWVNRKIYRNEFIDQVITNPGIQTMDSLYLLFTGISKQLGQEVTIQCPLSAFKKQVKSDSISFVVSDEGACAPFSTFTSNVSLSIADFTVSSAEDYLDGTEAVDWSGSRLEEPMTKSFIPTREMMLTISIEETDPYGLN